MSALSVRRAIARAAIALIAATVVFAPVAASADEVLRIEYLGGAEGMVVPSEGLFNRVAAMVPGDECSGSMTVRNSGDRPIALWFWTEESVARERDALLSQMGLDITDVATGEVLYRGSLRTKGCNDPIALGVYAPGDSAELLWTVSLPVRLGNEYQDCAACVTWMFAAEEEPDDPSNRLPPTGGLRPLESAVTGGGAIGIELPEGDPPASGDAFGPQWHGGVLPKTDDDFPFGAPLGGVLVSAGAFAVGICREVRKRTSGFAAAANRKA